MSNVVAGNDSGGVFDLDPVDGPGPEMTASRRADPFNARQLLDAPFISSKTIVRTTHATATAPMSHLSVSRGLIA